MQSLKRFIPLWFFTNFIVLTFIIPTGAYAKKTADIKYATEKIDFEKSQHLVVNLSYIPKKFDPQNFENTNFLVLLSALYEGLVIKDDNGNPLPGSAESWTNKNNQIFVFKLRENLKWSNGDKIHAKDFVTGFKRILDPKSKNPYTWYMKLMQIKNTEKILAGTLPLSKLGVKAIDSKHIKIELEKPVPYFLNMLAFGIMIPIHTKTYAKKGEKYWLSLPKLVTNGAYFIANSDSNKMELLPNPNYWDKKNVKIKKVTVLGIMDRNKESAMFFDSKLHISSLIKPDSYWSLLRKKPQNLINVEFLNAHYYQFQTQKPPFDNLKLRKALSYAVDRNYIVNGILSQKQTSLYTIIPKGLVKENTYVPKFSLLTQSLREKDAKLFFKQAGYNKENPLKFQLLVDETIKNKITEAKAIIKMWQRVLEFVEVDLVILPINKYLKALEDSKYHISKINWVADYKDASSFLSVLYSQNTYANSLFINKQYDEILYKAMSAKTIQQKEEKYNLLLKIIDEQMPIIPLYQDTNTYLVNKHLQGFPRTRSDGSYYIKDLYFKK